ncbi:MAG: hypothetical protein ACI9J3_000229 [Parvicellaceae bacterium]|jgi:hypothetical protein
MVRWIFLCFLTVIKVFSVNGQVNYFNSTFGNVDEFSERVNNVEVISDHFIVFGEERYSNEKWFVRKYNFEGDLQEEKYYDFDVAFLWTGSTTSFKKKDDNSGFRLSAEIWDSIGHWSYLMNFDLNLDTLWTKKYDYSSLHSGFDVGVESDNGFVVTGNYNTDYTLGSGEGTYLQSIDETGDVLWSALLKEEPINEIIKNKSILQVDDGYVLGGSVTNNSGSIQESQGYISKTDNQGNVMWDIISDDNGLTSSWFYLLELSNGDILCSHAVAYEEAPSLNWYHFKSKVYKLNTEEQNLYWEHDYLNDDNLSGVPLIPKETIDGGIILLGGRFGETTSSYYASLLKIDSLGNQEWYKEYYYEDCPDCFNNLLDIDIAPDGGFILTGEFFHSDGLPWYKQSWLLKVDACGDEEWEGCDIVGMDDIKRSEDLFIYPNPVSNIVFVNGLEESRTSLVIVYDLQGRLIWESKVLNGKIDVSQIEQGIYSLKFQENGKYLSTNTLSIIR